MKAPGWLRWLFSGGSVLIANSHRRHWTPISRALDVVGDLWTLLIASELLDGRLKSLRERVPGVTPATLDHHLRAMLAKA